MPPHAQPVNVSEQLGAPVATFRRRVSPPGESDSPRDGLDGLRLRLRLRDRRPAQTWRERESDSPRDGLDWLRLRDGLPASGAGVRRPGPVVRRPVVRRSGVRRPASGVRWSGVRGPASGVRGPASGVRHGVAVCSLGQRERSDSPRDGLDWLRLRLRLRLRDRCPTPTPTSDSDSGRSWRGRLRSARAGPERERSDSPRDGPDWLRLRLRLGWASGVRRPASGVRVRRPASGVRVPGCTTRCTRALSSPSAPRLAACSLGRLRLLDSRRALSVASGSSTRGVLSRSPSAPRLAACSLGRLRLPRLAVVGWRVGWASSGFARVAPCSAASRGPAVPPSAASPLTPPARGAVGLAPRGGAWGGTE